MNRYVYPNYQRPTQVYLEVGQIWLVKGWTPGTKFGFRITSIGPMPGGVTYDDCALWANCIWKTKDWFANKLMPVDLIDEYVFTGGSGFKYESKLRDECYLEHNFKDKINDDGYVCVSANGTVIRPRTR